MTVMDFGEEEEGHDRYFLRILIRIISTQAALVHRILIITSLGLAGCDEEKASSSSSATKEYSKHWGECGERRATCPQGWSWEENLSNWACHSGLSAYPMKGVRCSRIKDALISNLIFEGITTKEEIEDIRNEGGEKLLQEVLENNGISHELR